MFTTIRIDMIKMFRTDPISGADHTALIHPFNAKFRVYYFCIRKGENVEEYFREFANALEFLLEIGYELTFEHSFMRNNNRKTILE